MEKLTESKIEMLVLELLQQQGCEHLYGSDVAPERKKLAAKIFKKIFFNQSDIRSFEKLRHIPLPKLMNNDIRVRYGCAKDEEHV